MNVFTAMGRLGRDSQTNQTSGGTAVCNFALAVDSGYGDNKQTVWLDCSLWGKRAEGGLPDYLVKGVQVVVSGELGTREYQDGNGQTRQAVTLRVNGLSLAGGVQGQQQAKPQSQQQQRTQAPVPQQAAQQTTQSQAFDDFDDDIPFN